MSYIGNPPAEAYTNTVKDTFSGDGSTTAFTLSLPTTTNNVRVVVENVVQDPTVAYGVSGTTLTFTSAPPSGTNNIYVVHLGPAVQTVVPPDSVTITDLNAYADGAAAFTANRATSDGTIIDLQKNGFTVGSIGTATRPYFASPDWGLKIGQSGAQGYFEPTNQTGSALDASINIGASGTRWKDLYLSGGVYLGGTTSDNYLDDYEEGTWTPTLTGSSAGGTATYGTQEGYYTKVGNQVTAHVSVSVTALSGATGNLRIESLPFTSSSGSFAVGAVMINDLNWDAGTYATVYIGSAQSYMRIYLMTDDGGWTTQSPTNEVQHFIATISYIVPT